MDVYQIISILANVFVTVGIAFVAYVIFRDRIKKWTYDASYEALEKFEKDRQQKDIMAKVDATRNKYR